MSTLGWEIILLEVHNLLVIFDLRRWVGLLQFSEQIRAAAKEVVLESPPFLTGAPHRRRGSESGILPALIFRNLYKFNCRTKLEKFERLKNWGMMVEAEKSGSLTT